MSEVKRAEPEDLRKLAEQRARAAEVTNDERAQLRHETRAETYREVADVLEATDDPVSDLRSPGHGTRITVDPLRDVTRRTTIVAEPHLLDARYSLVREERDGSDWRTVGREPVREIEVEMGVVTGIANTYLGP